MKAWIRSLLMRWLDIPVNVEIKRFIFKGEPVEDFTEKHYESWATLWQTAPGLWDSWYLALGEVIKKMEALPATKENDGERIRLCQRAVDIWQNLQIANEAAKNLNDYHERQQRQQGQRMADHIGGQGASNLV